MTARAVSRWTRRGLAALLVALAGPLALAAPDAGAPVPLALAAPDAGAPARPAGRSLDEVKLLYFHASWCGGCKRVDEARVVERLQAREPGLRVERVDVDARREDVERYGVEYTPTLLLVDAEGFPLGKVRIELAAPDATVERGVRLVRKATGR